MRAPINKNQVLSNLFKLQKQKEAVMSKLNELHSKEKELTKWLTCLEGKSFCNGVRVYIENDIKHSPSREGSDRQATMEYTQ